MKENDEKESIKNRWDYEPDIFEDIKRAKRLLEGKQGYMYVFPNEEMAQAFCAKTLQHFNKDLNKEL
jgi:hypothetical protein